MGRAMARRRAGKKGVHMDDRMQSQAHGGVREGGRAWTAGCRLGTLETLTLEGGGRGRAEGKHGAGDEHGDTVGQEVTGKMPAVGDGQHGTGRQGDSHRGHGPPEDGPGTRSAAAEAVIVGYGIAGRCEHRGWAARGRPTVQASLSAGHQGVREACGATLEKSGSVLGTGVKEAYTDARGESWRVQRQKQRQGSHLSPGHSAPMEGGRTAGIPQMQSWRQGETTGEVCGVPQESRCRGAAHVGW